MSEASKNESSSEDQKVFGAKQKDWESIEQNEQERRVGIWRKIGSLANALFLKSRRKNQVGVSDDVEAFQQGEPIMMSDDSSAEERANELVDSADAGQKEPDDGLLVDMLEARDYFDIRESERNQNRHNERAQEILERELNSKLTTSEQLFDAVRAGDSGVEIMSKSYGDGWVPVITLKGMPYAMLTHTVDYRGKAVEGNNNSGNKTAQAVLDDPSVWAENLESAKNRQGFGTAGNADARGNVLCTSYTNSEHNMKTSYLFVDGTELTYGFNGVGPDSVIDATNSDGGTRNMLGNNPTGLDSAGYLEELETKPARGYNEITLRRYDLGGRPKLPDYIVAKDGKISEAALRHAKYFNIPIVNIETSVYKKRQKERAEKIIGTMSANEPYEEFRKKVDALYGLDVLGLDAWQQKSIGYNVPQLESKSNASHKDDFSKTLNHIETRDSLMSLNYVANQLRGQIEKMRSAIENGGSINAMPEGFETFDISLSDIQNLREKSYSSRLKGVSGKNIAKEGLGNSERSNIHVVFKMKGSPRVTDFLIEDGEHPAGGPEFVPSTADSRYYERLAPLVNEYLDLIP